MATRDVISVFSRVVQNFDRVPMGGGAKYEKQYFVGKTQKSHYFFNSGVQIPPPLPPPNDVPNDHRSHSLAYAEL